MPRILWAVADEYGAKDVIRASGKALGYPPAIVTTMHEVTAIYRWLKNEKIQDFSRR